MKLTADRLLRAVSSLSSGRKLLNELWNSKYKPKAPPEDKDIFIMESFLLREENRERQAVWIEQILDACGRGGGEWLFSHSDERGETLFAKVFRRIVELDAERSRGVNLSLAGENLPKDTIDGLYKKSGTALYGYVMGPGNIPEEFMESLNAELSEAMKAVAGKRIFRAMSKFEPHERGGLFLHKSHWAGRDDIAQLLLAGTPWVANLTARELGEARFPRGNLPGDSKGFFESCWSLGCEAAENGSFPPHLLKNYDAMNSVGVRPVRQPLPRPDYREIGKFFDMPLEQWYMNYLEPQLFLDAIFASFVSPARIMAENIDMIKQEHLPDEVLLKSYQGDFFIPPLVFTAYSAFKTLGKSDFNDFMKKYFSPPLSRFDEFHRQWRETDEAMQYMSCSAQREVLGRDWHKIPGFGTIGWPLEGEFLTRCRYFPSGKGAPMEEFPAFPERHFEKIINWSGAKIAQIVTLSTGWFPEDGATLKRHPEWIDGLFLPMWRTWSGKPEATTRELQSRKMSHPLTVEHFRAISGNADLWVEEGESICRQEGDAYVYDPRFIFNFTRFLAKGENEGLFHEGKNTTGGDIRSMGSRLGDSTLREAMKVLPEAPLSKLLLALKQQVAACMDDFLETLPPGLDPETECPDLSYGRGVGERLLTEKTFLDACAASISSIHSCTEDGERKADLGNDEEEWDFGLLM